MAIKHTHVFDGSSDPHSLQFGAQTHQHEHDDSKYSRMPISNRSSTPTMSSAFSHPFLFYAEAIEAASSDSHLVFVTMPVPSEDTEAELFMMWLESLSAVHTNCPVVFVRGTQNVLTQFM